MLENSERGSEQSTTSPLMVITGVWEGSAGDSSRAWALHMVCPCVAIGPPLAWPRHPGQVTLDFCFAICKMGLLLTSQDCYEAYVDHASRAWQVGT